jgi:replicative DNA helicase
MASVQLITRMIASETGISSEKLRKGQMSEEEWQRLFSNVSALENAPLYIDETPHFRFLILEQNAEDW